jgi:hypothetical protein
MSLGESRSSLEELLERELLRPGEGVLDQAQAQRVARAIAFAMEKNNLQLELQIRQSLQIAGIHV